MVFSIKANKYPKHLKNKIYLMARRAILFYPERVNEIVLNKYLISNYNVSLKLACLSILDNAKINLTGQGEITITFINKKYDDMATLITYGNGKLQGSKILKCAFMRQ